MAETSGFFQAMIDENTGDYDRKYLAREFANYFALFIKNGVFGSPTNQLKVTPGNGLSISVSSGNAFINGMWYNNSSEKTITLVPNYASSNRIDTVRVRMDDLLRVTAVDVYTGDIELVRTDDVYDLQLATVVVKPLATSITDAEIQDTRPNETVCGFVTQLLNVQTTADLFAQYQAQFNQWFENVKDQLSEDAAGNLQNQIDEMGVSLKEALNGKAYEKKIFSWDATLVPNGSKDEDGVLTHELLGTKLGDFTHALIGTSGISPLVDAQYFLIPLKNIVFDTVYKTTVVKGISLYNGKTYVRKIQFTQNAKLDDVIKVYPSIEIGSGVTDQQLNSIKGQTSTDVSNAQKLFLVNYLSLIRIEEKRD